MNEVPLHLVTLDGRAEPLGQWVHSERRLVLEREGFPFLARGTHVLESELPWLFDEMAPSGFLGARVARQFPQLGLPENRSLWSAEQVLRAISNVGEELSGNVLVGEESRRRYEQVVSQPRGGAFAADISALGSAVVNGTLDTGGSSLGGDRPKAVLRGLDVPPHGRVDVMVKFTPPLDTPMGLRWKHLLVIENLVSDVLRSHGLPSARAIFTPVPELNRAFLIVIRFDRTLLGGRVGASTLYWLAASRGEAELRAPEVMRSLQREGLVDQQSVERCELAHAFSAAIGNTDAHLGNYGLLFDERGAASLAPIYDVSPMIFAPRHDELPDARVTVRAASVDPSAAPLVSDLVARVRGSDQIDEQFKSLWLRYVGA